jgi:hypothetical protein
MSLYRHNTTGEVRDIDDARIAAWTAAANPKAAQWALYTVNPPPAFDPQTQKILQLPATFTGGQWVVTWQVAQLTQAEIDALAQSAETQAIRDLLPTLTADKAESEADQVEAQAYIDLAAPTNAERNAEVLNSAKRDKRRLQRERRQIRVLANLIRLL